VKSFSGTGAGLEFLAPHGSTVQWAVSGTFVGTVVLEQQQRRGGWVTIATAIAPTTNSFVADSFGRPMARYRFSCSAFTSGPIVTTFGSTPAVTPAGRGVAAVEMEFVENGAGTYTGAVAVPAGATLLNIIVNGVALWTAATSAAMDVGDGANAAGYFAAINLKATDLLAGESISFDLAGGKAGAYIANSQVSPRYSASARTISAVATSVGAGTAGRTRVTVVYHVPAAEADLTQAVKS
jgi:hypothetical protein